MKMHYYLKAGKIILITLFLINTVPAQDVTKVGTSAAPFLKIPVGARAAGMGGAFVSMVDDPSALYWNPGGLPRIERFAIFIDHSPWLPGLQHNFIGIKSCQLIIFIVSINSPAISIINHISVRHIN